METSKKQLRQAIKLIELFREQQRDIHPQAALCFLYVAYHGEIYQTELADILEISQASVSRNVALLSRWNRYRESGPDLLENYEDQFERRRKLVRLTVKGKALAKQIIDIINK